MEKTIKINLGGTLFLISEDAYHALRGYLQSLDQKFGILPDGNETIADIELRMAEIFSSQTSPGKIITKENVESAISVIGKPGDFEIPDDSAGQIPLRKRMFRNPDDKIIGGVCGGVGPYLGIDPVWIRLMFVVFTFFFGAGFLIYAALWIAVPPAGSEAEKREMYGNALYRERRYRQSAGLSRTGNAFNELFRAVARIIFIFVRIILIVAGVALLLSAFMALVTFIIVFVFKYPGAFSADFEGFELSYLPDFLSYLFTPPTAAWINILSSVIIILPLLMIIYWAVRMIFWFRVRDGVFNLAAVIIWVASIAALAVILLNEGANYAQHSNSTFSENLGPNHDTLFVVPGKRTAGLGYDNSIFIPDEHYEILIKEDPKEVYIRAAINLIPSESGDLQLEVKRRSSGRNRNTAGERTGAILHDFSVSRDTITIDEYFSYPEGMKWGFDNVSSRIYVPAGTIIATSVDHRNFENHSIWYRGDDNIPGSKGSMKFWKMTEDGPELEK